MKQKPKIIYKCFKGKKAEKELSKIFNLKWLLFLVFISCVGTVSAVECNEDLSQGGDSCTVSSSLTLNGSYTLNRNLSTSSTYALQIITSNLILDCNNTRIYGNNR